MTDPKFIGDCRNPQAIREFEEDLDLLLDDSLTDISEALPDRHVEFFDEDEDCRGIGNVLAIKDARIDAANASPKPARSEARLHFSEDDVRKFERVGSPPSSSGGHATCAKGRRVEVLAR
jgi:hypothetical protein